MTLRKDCKCPCHRAKHAIIHVVPCCGPGSIASARKEKPKFKRTKRRKLKLGTFRDKIVEVDPNWWKPMTEEEMEKEGWFNDLGV